MKENIPNLKDDWRMYGLVGYNFSPIQQAIQFAHSCVEYGLQAQAVKNSEDGNIYREWAVNNKTMIILNGGTTNTNVDKLGTLNMHLASLDQLEIPIAPFYEPDLGDQLTAIAFLLPAQVYDKKTYPDFIDYLAENVDNPGVKPGHQPKNELTTPEWAKIYPQHYNMWTKTLKHRNFSGEHIARIREFIKPFRLA